MKLLVDLIELDLVQPDLFVDLLHGSLPIQNDLVFLVVLLYTSLIINLLSTSFVGLV